ncbi:MAG: hypothetical protein LBP40_05155 [Campylobacteraceae bacterium]|jgi:quinol-cytochrome oxidoreductase complex cytochrome b subunit|nr:hypothetical protein [Campylobacteraceae bacterium]
MEKYSGFGILSLALSAVTVVGIFIFFNFVGFSAVSGSADSHETYQEFVRIESFYIIFIQFAMVAIGLGIAGVCTKGRKKLFAVLGLVFSIVVLLISFAVFIMDIIYNLPRDDVYVDIVIPHEVTPYY